MLMKKRTLSWLLAGVAFSLAALCMLVLFFAASWLKVADAPAKADAIVVLAGRFERTMYAADLHRQGYAPVIVLSEEVRQASSMQLEKFGIRLPDSLSIQRQILQASGVPADKIALLGRPSMSTFDEAEQIAARYGKAGARILVVTSPSHARRARLILERALDGRGAQLYVCATPYEELPERWWRSQEAAREVLLEWSKLAYYMLGGRFRASEAKA